MKMMWEDYAKECTYIRLCFRYSRLIRNAQYARLTEAAIDKYLANERRATS